MKNFKKIFKFMEKYKIIYISAIIFVIIAQILATVTPLIIQTTIDSILGGEKLTNNFVGKLISIFGSPSYIKNNLWLVGIFVILVAMTRGLFMFLRSLCANTASENTIKNIRNKLYDHIQRLPYEYHVQAETGELLQRCTSDIETVRRFIAIQFFEFIGSTFMLLFVLYTVFSLNVKMAFASIIILPVIFIFSFIFFRKIKKNFAIAEEREGKLSTTLQENLTGVRVVKAFSRQAFEIDKFDKINSSYRDSVYQLSLNLAQFWGLSDLIGMLQVRFIVVLGSYLSYKGEISLGTFAAFTTYVNMLVWPTRQIGRSLTDMGKAFVSYERIQKILDTPTEVFIENGEEPEILGNVELKNISFGYEEDSQVLSDISFNVKSGETIALIGPTGSGKSSLVHLLPRLYDYNKGSIKIDGIELNQIDKAWIRKNIGLVLQEPFLYAKTIKENIKLTNPTLEDRRVLEAAKVASIHEDIEAFEKGYDTFVGERGTSLSGGQKQRMAIARTIIEEKPIVIFDDSLSAVDTETDISIRTALNNRKNKATTIIISHRISTAAEADLILVLDKGKIIQRGTHHSLIKEEGLYKNIYEIQNSLDFDIEEVC